MSKHNDPLSYKLPLPEYDSKNMESLNQMLTTARSNKDYCLAQAKNIRSGKVTTIPGVSTEQSAEYFKALAIENSKDCNRYSAQLKLLR